MVLDAQFGTLNKLLRQPKVYSFLTKQIMNIIQTYIFILVISIYYDIKDRKYNRNVISDNGINTYNLAVIFYDTYQIFAC